MNTSLKVILSAVGVAFLASPVMAQSTSNANTAPSVAITSAHGSASHTHAGRDTRGHHYATQTPRVEDCVHVAFPQCGGDPTQVDSNRP